MRKTYRKIHIALILIILLILAFFSLQSYSAYNYLNKEIVGKNTFTQSMVQADGTTVNFYASGDQHFNYLHDENGYILLRENGYLVYARSNHNGRPTPTQVKFTDNQAKINSLAKMVYSDINFQANPDLFTEYPQSASAPANQAPTDGNEIVNIVIYICFSDEHVNLDNQMIDNYLNGANNSLTDYYNKISYGKINIHNINPIQNAQTGQIFIYRDNKPRAYYQIGRNHINREYRERTLLNNAVNASKEYFNLEDLNISTLNDGYVDAVNFLVSGSPYSEWGGMLWPHSWDLNYLSNSNPATIGGYKVKKYSFNFLEQLTVGLLAHEFAHVLGVPDLYHYEDNHAAVANWDLMHYEAEIPQYMVTHLRNKYLQVVDSRQIAKIEYNGNYSLRPVTKASDKDILAYKITTDKVGEYFMLEYRNNNVSGYDSSLPGSGLIIYRVKEGVTGNQDARKENTLFPDEVYVFRPNIVTTGTEQVQSVSNLNKAYLSPNNPEFMSLGYSLVQKPNTRYDKTTIYYTDGRNSGIVINAVSITDEEITFEVRLSGDNNVSDDYFVDKMQLTNVKLNNDENFSGVYARLIVEDNMNISNLNDIIIKLKNRDNVEIASIKANKSLFTVDYNSGIRSMPVKFVINNKGNPPEHTVFYQNIWYFFDEPHKVELYVVDSDNDYVLLDTYDIDKSVATWQSVEMTNVVYRASIETSSRITVAIRKDGHAFISSNDGALNQEAIVDVISAAVGGHHILLINSNLQVNCLLTSDNNGNQNEDAVYSWNNIIKVAVGDGASYGLDLMGKVFFAGNNAKNVSDWNNIIDIATGPDYIVGLKSDGSIVAVGAGTKISEVRNWQDINALACSSNFIAGLKKDGTVIIAGEISNKANITSWQNIVKISAGDRHLLAIDSNSKVFSEGNNDFNQCNINNPYDIIDIAAGQYHSVLLREDGQLLYSGENINETNNITQNLIYYNNDYVKATSIIKPFDKKIIRLGQTYKFNLAMMPHNATYKKITYSSNDTNVVNITSDGLMSAVAVGEAIITAKHRGSLIWIQINVEVIAPIATQAMIMSGDSHIALLNNEGTVIASGSNEYGQLNVDSWGNVNYIAVGGNTTIGLTPEGDVLVAGQMANMGAENWQNIKYVAVSKKTIVGMNQNGSYFSIGDNEFGQITKEEWSGAGVKDIKVSNTHTVILYSDGSVRAYGNNNNYQLNVSEWNLIESIAVGDGFTIGLCRNGTILYAGSSPFIDDITQLRSWIDIIYISASNKHIVGVDYDGKVWAIGNNSYGQASTASLINVGIISAGGEHTVAINYDGTVVGVGRNNDNRLSLPSVEPLPFIEANIQSISFEVESFGVKVGQTRKLNLLFWPLNATYRKSANISFTSDNNICASVDNKGYVTGITKGNATITANVQLSAGNSKSVTTEVIIYNEEDITSITLNSQPSRTIYSYGEKLDLLGGKITINLVGGVSFVKEIMPDMVVGYNSITFLSQKNIKVTIKEGDCETFYYIDVINVTKKIEFSSVTNLKTEYYYGEEIDVSNGWIVRTLADGTQMGAEHLAGLEGITIIASTELLASTIVTLRYIDPIAQNNGVVNILYLSYEIKVYDQIGEIEIDLETDTFGYGQDIYGRGNLVIRMVSGVEFTEPIIEGQAEEGGSVINILGFDKYSLGTREVTFEYLSPDFQVIPTMYPKKNITIEDSIEEVIITSMLLNGAAVFDTNKNIDLSISARMKFHGGFVVDISKNNVDGWSFESIYLAFAPIIPHIEEGSATTQMTVKVKGNGIFQDIYSSNLNVFGLSEVLSLELIGKEEFKYGETTNIQVKIATSKTEAHNPHIINIDDSVLGVDSNKLTAQVITFSLMGKTAQKIIIFKDYVTSIYTDLSSITVIVGQGANDFPLNVYKQMASGDDVLYANWWENSDYDYRDTTIGPRNISIWYADGDYHHSVTIVVEVIDVIEEIEVYSSPKTIYEVGDSADAFDFSIRLRFASEGTQIVYFNTNEFVITGYNAYLVGPQVMVITYLVTGDAFEFNIVVRNRIKRIEIGEGSKKVYILGEELQIIVYCVYENGDREIIDDYSHDYDQYRIGENIVVSISYWGKHIPILIDVIDAPSRIKITPPTKTHYQYGETLNLEGGKITFTTLTGEVKTDSLSAHAEYIYSFNPTPDSRGAQTVTISIHGISAAFTVYMKDKSSSDFLLAKQTAEGIIIEKYNNRVILDESTTIAEFSTKVSSYLDIYYKSPQGYLSLSSDRNQLLHGNISIEIRNSEGTLIETFAVFVKGDANNDGKFDENDIPILTQRLLQNPDAIITYADINGDRKYTLTDLIMWIKKLDTEGK